MRPIDAALLKEVAQGGTPAVIDALASELTARLTPASIDTPLRVAHFLGQSIYETDYCTRLEEELSYSAGRISRVWPKLRPRANALAADPIALANAAYAGRNGNGEEASGDGWRFRGRGLFMLTGRTNYEALGYSGNPDHLAEPDGAVESAVAYWAMHAISNTADEDDVSKVTRLVSGGSEGIAERAILKRRALRLMQS